MGSSGVLLVEGEAWVGSFGEFFRILWGSVEESSGSSCEGPSGREGGLVEVESSVGSSGGGSVEEYSGEFGAQRHHL